MSTDLAPSDRVDEQVAPTAPSRLASAARTVIGVASRLPVTAAVVIALIVTGVVSESLWRAAGSASWFEGVAYGAPALETGRWWTLLAGPWFGLTPLQHLSLIALAALGIGLGEWLLGPARTALAAVLGQLIGTLGAIAVLVPGDAAGWAWATELVSVLDVGCSTAVIGVLAAATARLASPWRLRARAVLYGYVIVAFLFLGELANLMHLIAFVVVLLVAERWFSGAERGLRPRTRRETRLLVSAGMWFIAAVHVVVYFFPSTGPLGPTEADDANLWAMLLSVLIAAATAELLRRGYRLAWWVALVYGLLTAVTTLVVTILVIAVDFESLGAVTAGTGLLWVGEVVLLVAGRSAFTARFRHRVTGAGEGSADVVESARTLLRRHGGSTMSWMITWQPMDYLLTADGDGVIGYRSHAGTFVALADPVAAPGERDRLLAEFERHAEAHAATPCLFSVSGETADLMRARGWRALQIAEDTLMDLPQLQFTGKKWQKIRSAMNKAEKGGTAFVSGRLADQPAAVLRQVREISEQWVGEKELPEMGFTLGTVEEALDPDVRVALAVDAEGVVQAALSWLPVYRGAEVGGVTGVPSGQAAGGDGEGGGDVRGWTLDLMRKRNGPGANNMIEFLIARSALEFKDEGADVLSLSGAPLARSEAEEDLRTLDHGLDLLGQALEPYYGFRSLHHFKSKFNPRVDPVYLCYRDEADLPRIGVAVGRAYLPGATPRQLAALARSGGSAD
ncbi:MAG: phosphatidylglycerol lysyltransferase domain-containing protein [Corynebacterium sp.]|uniref:bifunctional lysylphosphatidylglycerol flippase/synthetase MprF n=1 Tax=Corynebacterium sp. TaxID=1720 RepID=UPI0026474956|nr:DUF2156 domain-containing protein [Corynebacterium sp.]MDN5723890.1 phosphatidylglycerol lysyltransferase domain-containing protein [Corynebacterium sp.]